MKIFYSTLSTLLLGLSVCLAGQKETKDVKVTGTLRTGIMAIGGETTGTTITAKGVTWELDFGKHAEMRKMAPKFDGKKVTVRGDLERRQGVEIKERWILKVASMNEPGAGDDVAELEATTRRGTSRVDIEQSGGKTVFDITSQVGIDVAAITRKSEKWPETILVRLHLRGLESFKVETGKMAVEWSVSSSGKNAPRVTLWEGRKETPIDQKSPYFSASKRAAGKDGKGGHFEVLLPAKLFEGNPEEIVLRWIDFYR